MARTFRGGAIGAGSVFAMTAEGALTTLYSFTGEATAAILRVELVQGTDGSLLWHDRRRWPV